MDPEPTDDPDPHGARPGDQSDDLLAEFDAEYAAALLDESEIEPSTAVQRFRRNTAAGAVLTGMALGLREVFDPVEREEAPITQDAPGEPDHPRHVDAHLDPDDPTASSVTVRPWVADAERADAERAEQNGSQDHER